MSLHTSTGKPTKYQEYRFVSIKLETGCVCCRMEGIGYVAPEIHHLLSGGRRIGHDATIGLCPYHHRGQSNRFDIWTSKPMLGPSLASGSKPFNAYWGSDAELLAYQNKLLGLPEQEALDKRSSRRAKPIKKRSKPYTAPTKQIPRNSA